MVSSNQMRRRGITVTPAQFIAMIIVVVLTLLLASLVAATNDSYNLRRVEQNEQRKLAALAMENADLKKQRDRLKTDDEIERLVREKLGYLRAGEVAIVPQTVERAQPSATVIDQPQTAPVIPAKAPEKPHWQKWLELFQNP